MNTFKLTMMSNAHFSFTKKYQLSYAYKDEKEDVV